MALSTQTVVSDGTLVLLDISIEYLDRSEITVYFNSTPTTAWAWVGTTDKQITFSPAVPAGVTVLVKRTTVLSSLRHSFSLGAAFTAQYLDESLLQVLHITQEAVEANFSSDFYAPLNLHMNQIHNVADPTSPQDVATKAWSETGMTAQLASATAQANAAATSASEAAASKTAADADAASALASKNAAALSETNAAASATSASGSATSATASASSASGSATAAANSATAAQTAEASTLLTYDAFDDRWLGTKAVAPTLDNDGNALLVGAAYYDSVALELRIWTGTVWTTVMSRTAATGSARIPSGLSSERDVSPSVGFFRFNTTLNQFEGYNGTAWDAVGGNAVKAWVNFNGTGTVAIRAAYNVSSITDNGVGDYTVNFANALADSNYGFHFSVAATAATDPNGVTQGRGTNTTAGFRFMCGYNSTIPSDPDYVAAVALR